jgi:hypothetical protein
VPVAYRASAAPRTLAGQVGSSLALRRRRRSQTWCSSPALERCGAGQRATPTVATLEQNSAPGFGRGCPDQATTKHAARSTAVCWSASSWNTNTELNLNLAVNSVAAHPGRNFLLVSRYPVY